MKNFYVFASCILFIICLNEFSFSQTYMYGVLKMTVERPEGIPTITISTTDTSIDMGEETIKQIFENNHVYEFKRAFPAVDQTPNPNEFDLNKVYELSCECNEDHLRSQLLEVSSGLYTNINKVQQTILLYDPNDYDLLNGDTLSGPDSALNMINAKQAWDYTHGDTTIIIGIVDRNLIHPSDWNHEDIVGKITYWDTVNGDYNEFHGLFVSGSAAGNTDNFRGKSSIGFNCPIFFNSHVVDPIKAYNALLDLSNKGVKVLNVSWLSGGYDTNEQNMINKITNNGTLVVAAAGNSERGYQYPASYANVLSVTGVAFNFHHKISDSLNWNFNDSVDISAPGYYIVGLWDSCDTCYKRSSGTSFASPIVAGTAGLIFSLNPCLTPADVTYILKSTANDTIYSIPENFQFINSLGTGSLDAGAALQKAHEFYQAQDDTIRNGQNVVWEVTKYVAHEIVIEPGAVLTIRGKVLFNKNAKITVMVGGKLIVDGGWLTNNCTCSLWSGIDVWGNANASQYYPVQQGVAVFQNGAMVENAITAVRTLTPIPSDNNWIYDPSGTGGIIIASNSVFRNNQRAVLFLPYENFHPFNHSILNNYSSFTMCTFETNEILIDSTKTPTCFVDLNGVRGIRFSGCTFQNNQIGSVRRYERGNGINSINSGFYINFSCSAYNQEECIQYITSKFKNLNYGIKSLGTGTIKPVSIDNSLFYQNYTGVYLGSVQQAQITRDTFNVQNANPDTFDTIGGLYLDQCTGYIVEENKFQSSYPQFGTGKSTGIAVNKSNVGSNSYVDNRIYNNSFEKLNYAILAMNKNRSMNGDYGLSILCNDFDSLHPNEYDISVTKDDPNAQNMGIKFNQGSDGAAKTDPAGNTFSYRLPSGPQYTDYLNDCEDIVYWYHFISNGKHVEPKNYTPLTVDPESNYNNQYPFIKSQCCPSSFSSGGGGIEDMISEKNEALEKIDSIGELLDWLVDGGDTPGTDFYVQNSTSSQTLEVRDDLLSKSPYLSDSVMVSAAAKEEVLPSAIITEILSANPQAAKSDTVMEILDNRITPLTDDQWSDIEEGLFITGAKESLESRLYGYMSDYYNTLNRIIRYYKIDTLNLASSDSVIWFLNSENQLWAKYSLAFEYFAKGDTLSAEITLIDIPGDFSLNSSELNEHQQYLIFFDLLKQLKWQGKSLPYVDSLQIQTIAAIMNNSEGVVSGYARNILLTLGEVVYKEPYVFPADGLKSSKIRHRSNFENHTSNELKIFPNPARDYIIIEYALKEEPGNTIMKLYDAAGKVIRKISVNDTHDWLIVPVSDLSEGTYLCSLHFNDNTVKNARFVVIR
jgi:hypothetical protein